MSGSKAARKKKKKRPGVSHSHGGDSRGEAAMVHGPHDPGADQEELAEQQHLEEVVLSFLDYRRRALQALALTASRLSSLRAEHQAALSFMPGVLTRSREAIIQNGAFIDVMLNGQGVCDSTDALREYMDRDPDGAAAQVSFDNASKAESTLKQMVRDWSAEGAAEREACYGPVIAALRHRIPVPVDPATGVRARVIVPGCGLARLAFELAALGFNAQGNEFSYHMLVASHFVLNGMPEAEAHAIHPFVTAPSNHRSRADQCRAIRIPDVSPFSLPPGSQFSMASGDFLEAYADEAASVDAFVTVFFIDTARNILSYIDLMARALRPGGLWINNGPLLYHFADMADHLSVELAWDELRALILARGFRLEDERTVDCTYAANGRAMLTNVYHCQFFVAVRL
eukprot:c39387_g1_i1.p1 GENE.c39387_g1_i1~~c39387_g1_i1.p1  ORF type:complete len:400 (-),score=55.98 c39387_g1_i1:19-1218(-)